MRFATSDGTIMKHIALSLASAALLALMPFVSHAQASSSFTSADHPTAQSVLAATDSVRNPEHSFRVTLALVEYINGKPRDRTGLTVFTRSDPQSRQFENL